DEIIQSVELGDTKLTIPSTAYTGDLPAHNGLFGAAAKGKIGGIDLYAIASTEQSQSQTASFTGKRVVSTDTIDEYNYVARTFYHIDVPGTITQLQVYIDDCNPSNNQATYKAIATVMPNSPDSQPANYSYDRWPGDFDLKSPGKDYSIETGSIIEFANALNSTDVVGLYIVTTNPDDTFGNIRGKWRDSLVLKLLRPKNPDSTSLTWNDELRNVYKLPQTDVSLSSLQIFRRQPSGANVEYEDAGANSGQKFRDLLGLDPNHDGRVEYPEFDTKTGLIRFPGATPFDTSALSVRDRVIYRKDPATLSSGEGQEYYMVAEYSSATSSYYLGQPDITSGSEKVTVNGLQWVSPTDYKIDYSTGILSFVRALPPDADISVTYEYNPLLMVEQKSLVGTRAEWAPSEQAKFGSSVFYRSEGTQDEKPSIGSEPFSRLIAETDASYAVNSDAVSAFLDRLPLLRAQAPSAFGVSAEGAVSMPNPNTRGVAYLDDFEGTAITRDVSVTALLWSWSSVPVGKDTEHFAHTRLFWNNPSARVRNDSVFGPSVGSDATSTHDVLRVVFTPDSGDPGSWAGMMTSAAQAGVGMNLADVDNLQMVMKSRGRTGTIHVTIGTSIDEDAPRRNRAGAIVGLDGLNDTEDKNGNGVLDDGEDVGLDGVAGVDSLWKTGSADDGDDDYNSQTNPQGTEGNTHLDQEDLTGTGFTRYNHYFEGTIQLGDSRYFSNLVNGWKLCRVSLRDSTVFKTVGQPRWENIQLVRIWVDGFDQADTVDFYSIDFVGSRWTGLQLASLRDTIRAPGHVPADTTEKIWATAVSKKTDTSYSSPFALKRDASGNLEEEGALLFGYQNLHGYRLATVDKALTDQEDYREYSDLRLYVHDDGNGLAFLLKLGADSANYYEYQAPVTSGQLVPGRDGKWYEFVIPLDSLPVLKLRRDEADVPRNTLWASGPYSVLGSPALSAIRYTVLGIENRGSAKISGGLWFDDMRLTAPHTEAGYGFQARSNIALSDFVSLAVSCQYSDPNFRHFSDARGMPGSNGFGTSLGASVQANLDRLLPASWGVSVPLGYSISDQLNVPKFSPLYPDLLLPESLASSPDYVSTGRSDVISLNNIHKQKSGNRWLNYTLEGMSLSWNDRHGHDLGPLNRDSSWASALAWTYAVTPDVKVKIGSDDELTLLPDVKVGITNERQLTLSGTRTVLDSAFRFDTTRGNGISTDLGIDYSPIEDMTFSYGVQTERDLLVPTPDTLLFFTTGTEASRQHSLDASYNLEVADAITPGIDFNGDYSDERTKAVAGYSDSRNMNNSGDISFTLGTDLPELLGGLGSENAAGGKIHSGRRPPKQKSDTLRRDSSAFRDTASGTVKSPPKGEGSSNVLQQAAGFLSRTLQPLDLSYSIARTSDLVGVYDASPWPYRLGFTDIFAFDTLHQSPTTTRERHNTLRASSGGHVSDLTAQIACELSQGEVLPSLPQSPTLDRSLTWPELDLTQDKVEKLFKNWATDSKLTASYKHRLDIGGQFVPYYELGNGDSVALESLGMRNRNETDDNEFSPLLSWSTTWKRRFSTTLSVNYTFGTTTIFLDDSGAARSVTYSNDRGANLSLSYTFSAPQGLRLPLLGKLRFSSDLSLTWSLQANQTHRYLQQWVSRDSADSATELERNNTLSTSLAASYRFSRSMEAGLTAEYSQNRGLAITTTTESMDLDLWVLFKF
ncbi:MAG TPA: hypothetical protein VMH22_04325, partial [bacterium]|nr:hypothetical protein [bacterium]